MTDSSELLSIERRLSRSPLDFSETFVRVGQLKDLIDGGRSRVTDNTVTVLAKLLESDRHIEQTQAFHLFSSIASALTAIACSRCNANVSRRALQILMPAVTGSRGEKQRASAQTVGMLPMDIKGPRVPSLDSGGDTPRLLVKDILSRVGRPSAGDRVYLGRSLVIALENSAEVLVIKITRRGESRAGLVREARWMDYLAGNNRWVAGRFIVPRPLKLYDGYLFKPADLPDMNGNYKEIDPATAAAIAFTVHRDYFVYPNDHRPGSRLPYDRFRRILLRAAGLFGELAAAGIVHTAPIPLFHNRVQRDRRDDGGIYEWDRGGRLDRWLLSSRFPNFGPTGIRDFEHMLSLGENDGRRLYRHIGNHLLSLILVIGSYFRYAAPEMVGGDEHGVPLDVRSLFDKDQFTDLVDGVFKTYFSGFSKAGPGPDMAADIKILVESLINHMGVDRHMREIMRIEDQNRMSDGVFRDFLARYRLQAESAAIIEKGRADIEVRSGPHLGEFNGPISVPELTSFLRAASAAIVAGRYMGQKFPEGEGISRG